MLEVRGQLPQYLQVVGRATVGRESSEVRQDRAEIDVTLFRKFGSGSGNAIGRQQVELADRPGHRACIEHSGHSWHECLVPVFIPQAQPTQRAIE